MKILYYAIFAIISLLLMSCAVTRSAFPLVSVGYVAYEAEVGKECRMQYSFQAPKGYKKLFINGQHEAEVRLFYQDSSFIYITNDSRSGSNLNYNHILKADPGVFTKKLLNDTVVVEGAQANKHFWKEAKLSVVTIGYSNVLSKNRLLYEESIASLRLIHKRCKRM